MTTQQESTTDDATRTVVALWRALSNRQWDEVKTYLSEDCIYFDVPAGAQFASRGPDDAVKRLRIALEPLASYENHDGVLLSDGTDVMYEHSETWHWADGGVGRPFVTVHRVVDGLVTVWKDYWDMRALTDHAPASWMSDFATADMSWIYDATGQV